MRSLRVRVLVMVASLAAIVVGAALAFMALEDRSFFDSLYFAVTTISTVGYGDIYPTTAGGKVVVIVLIVVGVGAFLTVAVESLQLVLQRRQELIRQRGLQMLVGVFFSEIGTRLLQILSGCDPDLDRIRQDLILGQDWSEREFAAVNARLERHAYSIDPARMRFDSLRAYLMEKGDLLLRLLENPNLMEHESFTDLIVAISHVKEELVSRPEPLVVPDTDLAHLANDARRVYVLLAKQWVSYMLHLRKEYPYLFSLALRTNPFCVDRSAIVT